VTIQVRPTDGGLVVSGELDMAAADEFRQYAASAVDPTREVVLDIEELVFVDSSGLKAILRLTETACPHGIVLRWPRDNVLRVLDILNVEGVRGIRVERRPSGGPS
jgi:anti-anti-sigma factor